MLGEGLAKDCASCNGSSTLPLLLLRFPHFLACLLMNYLNRNENGLERGPIYNRSHCNTPRSPF